MDFDLENCGSYSGVTKKIHDQRSLEVGDANGLRKTKVDERFHSSPRLLDASFALDNFTFEVLPSRGVAVLGINVFESHREVDIEDVEVSSRRRSGIKMRIKW